MFPCVSVYILTASKVCGRGGQYLQERVCISLLARRRGKRRAEEWRRGSHSTLVLAERRSGGSEAKVCSREPFRDCGEEMEEVYTVGAYSTVETRDYKKGCCTGKREV